LPAEVRLKPSEPPVPTKLDFALTSDPSEEEPDRAPPQHVRDSGERSELEASFAKARANLTQVAKAHLTFVITKLIQAERMQSQAARWTELAIALATRASNCVRPSVHSGDKMDVRAFVKVTTIPGGRMDECSYVDGVVFRKNVAHKAMRTAIENPKILLLLGALELLARQLVQLRNLVVFFEQPAADQPLRVKLSLEVPHTLVEVSAAAALDWRAQLAAPAAPPHSPCATTPTAGP